jgi:hypothetical protein
VETRADLNVAATLTRKTGCIARGRGGCTLRIGGARHLLVKVGEDFWPGVLVADSGLLVGEASVREAEMRAAVCELQFDPHYCLGASCCAGEPSQFHEMIAFEPEETSVVRMARAFVMRFEEEWRVDLPLHQNRIRGREPTIDLLGPRAEQDGGWREHGALNCQAEGS